MKLIQLINNIITHKIQLVESDDTLLANLRAVINDDGSLSEDKAHTIAKVIVMWDIIKNDMTSLRTALTYDMVCAIVQRILTSNNNHTLITNDMMNVASTIYGDPKNIIKVQKYITKLGKQVDTKINYKIRAMNIASMLLNKHTDPKIKLQLLDML